MIEEQQNNPLHGVKTETVLTELVDHYGWEILACDTNINCFKKNPDIKSSLKFLKKNDWAREKLETFYLYKFKRLPKPDDTQYALPPRERAVPLNQKPREPLELTIESIQAAQQRKAERAKNRPSRGGQRGNQSARQNSTPYKNSNRSSNKRTEAKDKERDTKPTSPSDDPWAKWR